MESSTEAAKDRIEKLHERLAAVAFVVRSLSGREPASDPSDFEQWKEDCVKDR